MQKIIRALYHFYQYRIKPTKKHRIVIKQARKELTKIRSLQHAYQPSYLLGVLRNIDPFVFEEMLLLCFKERGFRVRRNSRYTGDGGIDGTVFNPAGQKLLIQAKRYSSAINPQHVADFVSVIERFSAQGGYFIHTGRTGEKSKLAKTQNIRFLSGDTLLSLVVGK